MSFKENISLFSRDFDLKLEKELNNMGSLAEDLEGAIKYILFSGGKRIRPYLMVETFKLFSNNLEMVRDFSMAMELVHTYSLVHDDLPAMDNDDYRRGKLTVHKKYGEDMAILVGDGLQSYAYELLTKNYSSSSEGSENFIHALRVFSQASGVSGMIAGQVLDMELEKDRAGVDILRMYELKTGMLFKASAEIGAILSGTTSRNIESLSKFGRNLGLAYQIQDDILDYNEDLAVEKPTLATIEGIAKAEDLVNDYTREAESILEDLGPETRTGNLEELLYVLSKREY